MARTQYGFAGHDLLDMTSYTATIIDWLSVFTRKGGCCRFCSMRGHTSNGMRDCGLILDERFAAQERPEMRDTAGAVSRAEICGEGGTLRVRSKRPCAVGALNLPRRR